ncbi:MAG: hypothetical protein ACTSQL_12035 [Promethearchaeota archaeon]
MKSYVRRHPVLTYFFLTYIITWTCWITVILLIGPYVAAPELAPISLLIFLEILLKIGVFGPGIAGKVAFEILLAEYSNGRLTQSIICLPSSYRS